MNSLMLNHNTCSVLDMTEEQDSVMFDHCDALLVTPGNL